MTDLDAARSRLTRPIMQGAPTSMPRGMTAAEYAAQYMNPEEQAYFQAINRTPYDQLTNEYERGRWDAQDPSLWNARLQQDADALGQYHEWLRSQGIDPTKPMNLSDEQRKAAKAFLAKIGYQGTGEIDPAGNFNQAEGFTKQFNKYIPYVVGGLAAGAAAPVIAGALAGGATTGGAGIGASGGIGMGGAGLGGGGAIGGTAAGTAAGTGGLAATAGTLAPLSATSGFGGLAAGGGMAGIPTATLGGTAATGLGVGTGVSGGLANAVGSGGGGLGSIGKYLNKDTLGAAAKAIGDTSQAAASNRGTAMDAELWAEQQSQQRLRDYYEASLSREKEGREGLKDAWNNQLRADYVANRGDFTAPSYLAGYTDYGFTPKASTDAQKQAAAAMSTEAMGRLQGGNPLAPIEKPERFAFDPKNLTPGNIEKYSPWVAGGLSALGGYFGSR